MYCRALFELSAPLSLCFPPQIAIHPNAPSRHSLPSHLYHSKQVINYLVSYTSAPLPAQTLSFDRHPFLTGGRVGYQSRQRRVHPLAPGAAHDLSAQPRHFRFPSRAGNSNRPIDSSHYSELSTVHRGLPHLTPLHPLHARLSPVSPLFPLDTKNTGGGGACSHRQPPFSLTYKLLTTNCRPGSPNCPSILLRAAIPSILNIPLP
jgi:hypothetical protein